VTGDLTLRDIDVQCPQEFLRCAEIAAESEIGKRYGFSAAGLAAKIKAGVDSGAMVFVAESETGENRIKGFAWVDPRGAFGSSPYLKLIAVDASLRGKGGGALLLAEFERRTASIGRVWTLMVSDFNEKAVAFYQRHGYERAGLLPDFAVPGVGEILMVKRRGNDG
jgi:GNAT superfamily N-acetyltransferase